MHKLTQTNPAEKMKFRLQLWSLIFTTTHVYRAHRLNLFDEITLNIAGMTYSPRRRLFRSWRIHYQITRAALTRVVSYGSVEQAAQNTDLSFYILHHCEILKEAVKKIALRQLHI